MNARGFALMVAVGTCVVGLTACAAPTEPHRRTIAGLERVVPPEEYRSWWEATEACSSTEGDFELVRWYRATTITSQGEDVLGQWERPHDITVRADQAMNEFVVRHEILHDLLRGDVVHQSSAWSQCGLLALPTLAGSFPQQPFRD